MDNLDSSLVVAVIDLSRARAAVVEEGLRAAGVARVTVIPDTADLANRLAILNPHVIVVDVESPGRDVLEQLFEMSRQIARPIAMFVDRSDEKTMRDAIDAGISAYVVDGLRPERIKPILDIAILRFRAYERLQRELADARSELAERRLVDRAKQVLMRLKQVSEDEAYGLMRRTAMNEKIKIGEVARSVLMTADLLK